jgi:hypothetical protein
MSNAFVYPALFCIGFINEYLLTSYYIHAAKGHRWLCMGLTMLQQSMSFTALWFNIVDGSPSIHERICRWFVTGLSYGAATYFVVKPASKSN